jgi:hypothetical protein
MTLAEANKAIRDCADKMNDIYGKTVFDEWVIMSLIPDQLRVLSYFGPRRGDFQKNFTADLQDLKEDLLSNRHDIGDFEFTKHGTGTKIEAFMVVGDGLFLFCNNIELSMSKISQNPLWLSAQVPFVALSDKLRSDPLIYPL